MSHTRQVPFFNYQSLFKTHAKEYLDVMSDVGQRGAYILQRDVFDFEKNISEFVGVKHCVSVANGTDGLMIAYRAAGLEPEDEVIMPAHTYVATAASVHLLGGKPILVECGQDHMVDPKAIKNAITSKTKFLSPVQVNGRTCNMDEVQEIADDHGLQIIEDSAQALGSKFKGKCAGTFGLAGMFSFYPAKVLGSFGDGGCVVTNSDELAAKMKLWRDHGRNDEGEVVGWGLNSRLDNIHAAILNFKLKNYPQEIKHRREIAGIYQSQLADLDELTLPPGPEANQDHFDIYQNYELEADNRDALKQHLTDNGVGTIIQWGGKAVHQLTGLGFDDVKLPVTEEMTSRFLMLPMHQMLANDDVNYVCEHIRKFYRS
ncbi:DegT/DnrJ/EryC1/StrS family aminotransferase [Bdellovibrionales bacterium]|nr:DegT/DnrJ/EryC1/StrS family aminotransferase [Bdellovibrionales bacterium]